MRKLKMASFFAGCGGIDLGFHQTGKVETAYVNEIDKYPVHTYEINFGFKVDNRDIRLVKGEDIPSIDILAGGFPCQPFSTCGKRLGFDDRRGNLFFEMARLIKEKNPKVVFFENVASLKTFKDGFGLILETLSVLGYFVKYKVLDAAKVTGIPQHRERIYIVGFKDKSAFDKFSFPEENMKPRSIRKYVDLDSKLEDRYYIKNLTKGKLIEDIADNSESFYCYRYGKPTKKMNNVCFTLLASMGGTSIPSVKTKYGMRRLTPREAFNLQGFPEDFKLDIENLSHSRLYKQAGNSVCVPVIRKIAEQILEAVQ